MFRTLLVPHYGIHLLLHKTYQQGCYRESEAATTLCQAVTNSQPMWQPLMQEKLLKCCSDYNSDRI